MDLYSLEAWEQPLRDCLTLPYLLTRCLIPILKNPLTLLSSSAAWISGGQGRVVAWGALAGLDNVSQVWADEAEKLGLRFNTLDPGWVKSALRRKFYPAESDAGLRTPNDSKLIHTYLYLLSDAGRQENGQRFTVPDAGKTVEDASET